jgi:hypothetical protein
MRLHLIAPPVLPAEADRRVLREGRHRGSGVFAPGASEAHGQPRSRRAL